MSEKSKSCLVIGAGISGLIIARKLSCAGIRVKVLDKGRGVGGRMATRRFGGGRVDHGAQYFTVRGPRMRELVRSLENARILRVWSQGFHSLEKGFVRDGISRYMALNGMSSIAKVLADDLTVHTGVKVSGAVRDGLHWKVSDDDGKVWVADYLAVTAPAEQSLQILGLDPGLLSAEERSTLKSVQYNPCYAAMVRLDGPSRIPPPGGVWCNGDPIIWIADNRAKGLPHGGDADTLVTIHASPEFTRRHWDSPKAEVAAMLVSAAAEWLGDSTVLEVEAHRWKYSQALQQMDPPYLMLDGTPMGIVAGDGFGGGKVEGAVDSAVLAAEAFIEKIQTN
jgi:hypothetical protein